MSGARTRYFLFSFSLAFCAWSMLYLFLAYVVHPSTEQALAAPTDVREPAYLPAQGDSLTVLFMGTQSLAEPPTAYVLARFDPANGRVAICALPGNLTADHNGSPESLGEVYAYGGGTYTREVLAKTLGVPIDRQVRLTPDSFTACAQAVGSVELNLPEALRAVQDGTIVEFAEGLQLLDGKRALQILRFGYSVQAQSLNVLASFAAAAVEQRRDVILSTLADKVFEQIVNHADTDISYTDYIDRKSAAVYFAQLPGPVTKIIPLSGRTENGRYLVSDTFLAELTQYFG